jgi:hypothetical protein
MRENATMARQGISMDFGFIVQRSKDTTRFKKVMGINCDTAYLLISDHFSDHLWSLAVTGKIPPIAWLNRWFTQFRPSSAKFRYTSMDDSGVLAHNPNVLALL